MSESVNDFGVPLQEWTLATCLILDWYDGPLEGICKMQSPAICFYFKAINIQRQHDDVDRVLYSARIVTNAAVMDNLLSYLTPSTAAVPAYHRPYAELAEPIVEAELARVLGLLTTAPEYLLKAEYMTRFLALQKAS